MDHGRHDLADAVFLRPSDLHHPPGARGRVSQDEHTTAIIRININHALKADPAQQGLNARRVRAQRATFA
eukprot:5171600-Prymnesium_polylepis.1